MIELNSLRLKSRNTRSKLQRDIKFEQTHLVEIAVTLIVIFSLIRVLCVHWIFYSTLVCLKCAVRSNFGIFSHYYCHFYYTFSFSRALLHHNERNYVSDIYWKVKHTRALTSLILITTKFAEKKKRYVESD